MASLWLVLPSAAPKGALPTHLKVQHCPPPVCTHTSPSLAPLALEELLGGGHSHHICLEGRRCTSVLNTFPFLDHWKLPQELERHPELQMGNVLSNPDTLCRNWEDWLKSGHLSCPSSPLAAPFPCAAGGPGVHRNEGTFGQRLHSQSFDLFFSSKDKQANRETGKGSGKYVHFPISCCLNIKTQPTKPASMYLSHLQILPPKINLYILMGMAVSFPPPFWILALYPLDSSSEVNKFLPTSGLQINPQDGTFSGKEAGDWFFLLMDVNPGKFLNFAF